MNRREFLRRIAVGSIAIQMVDPKMLQAAFTEVQPTVDIIRGGSVIASGPIDEILKTYYLPPMREMLNSSEILGRRVLRVPLHLGRSQGITEYPETAFAQPAVQQEYGEARVYLV